MSRLRVPFRSKQSSTQVNGTVPSTPTASKPTPEPVTSDYWSASDVAPTVVEKGKAKVVERLWGIENFGNTCYCNSVLQALYACEPFKQFVESYPDVAAPTMALGPAPGDAKAFVIPSSPVAAKQDNPFENPALNTAMSPASGKRGLFGRRPTSSNINTITPTPAEKSTSSVTFYTAETDVPPAAANPDGQPPTVFETVQTLFQHLSTSIPHQPLPARKDAKADANNAQTASLLPAAGPDAAPASPANPNPSPGNPPPGPPLLASLPPPSAPRGGGPFQAGTLGRGVVRPEDLLKTVKRENEMFRGMNQQDAHEFLGWVLNKIAEDIEVVDRSLREVGKEVSEAKGHGKTFVQNLFEGILTNETRCLTCETTSSRDELFLDLSIDIEQHTSVTACLRQFSASEMLCQKNKFFCDSCCGLQEAEKRMKIKRLPNILALHLKRFKYQENLGRYTKLFYRVPFPTQLRLPNTSDDTEDPDRLYELFAVVVHIGNGPHHGHYVCLIRSAGRWVMCDDENVEPIADNDIYRYFGDYPSGAGYVLFYQAVDLDLASLGLKVPPTKPSSDLMDIDETQENEPVAESPKTPLRVTIPSPASPVTPIAPVIKPTPVDVPTLAPPIKPIVPAKTEFHNPFEDPDQHLGNGHAQANGTSPSALSSSVMSNDSSVASFSQETSSSRPTPPKHLSTSPLPNASAPVNISLGRNPSQSNKERVVSASSQSSTSGSTDKYAGGGGLSRRLSGISVSKLGRSGSMSFGKLGFGKKDKEKNGMGGVKE